MDKLTTFNQSLHLTEEQRDDIRQLAAVGLSPREIAAGADLTAEQTREFVEQAATPGSEPARLIAEGRAAGVAGPQVKMQQAASAGNIEAIKQLQKTQAANQFKTLLLNMDDDELQC